jgi:hypothetical protein
VKALFKSALLLTMLLAGSAQAASVLYIHNETFQSGAVFNGKVTFADNTYSQAIGVSGVLQGGIWGTQILSWAWSAGSNFASGDNYGTFLMNGTNYSDYSIWNTFTIDKITLTFNDLVGYGNNINYFDTRTGGTISATAPIPAAMWLFGSAIAGMISFKKRKTVA